MKNTNEEFMINSGKDDSKEIESQFPEFYKANLERIQSGKIKLFTEMWSIEGGVLIDIETFETIFVDYRS